MHKYLKNHYDSTAGNNAGGFLDFVPRRTLALSMLQCYTRDTGEVSQ